MTTLTRFVLVLAGTLAPAAGCFAAAASTYKWVDDQGVTHYGDTVPNEAMQKDRALLNDRGVEVGRLEGRKSAADLAAARARDEQAEQHRQHDQFLISTYGSVKDIENLRDERLDQIDGQIKATTLYIDSLDTRLRALQDRAMGFKPYSTKPDAHRMPDDLAEDLVRAASERRTQVAALDKRRAELGSVRDQFNGDITRYRELVSSSAR